MPDFVKILQAKSAGNRLSLADIQSLVEGVTSGDLTDAQLGAFTMAVCYQGMSMDEEVALTLAMRDSGQRLRWPDLPGPVLDKHSTGGVGDLVSLLLGPMLAACGAFVPMISGRGLGHTGGTLDKLESIPGFRTNPDLERFRELVRQNGIAIVGQTDDLAPADRRMYATRDETSTIPSIPLIVSSILSKKFAEGLDGLVLDVKTGNGAFMREREAAQALARELVRVSFHAGLPCSALITDMNQPLAGSAGNSLEVREAIAFLAGRRHPRLEAVTLALGASALQRVRLASGDDDALAMCRAALDSGRAAEVFSRMVAGQGGPANLLETADRSLEHAPIARPLPAPAEGWVTAFDTRGVGLAVMYLGGGRQQLADKIDPRVGLSALCSIGDPVEKGAPLAIIHAADEDQWSRAAQTLAGAIRIGHDAVTAPPCIYEEFGMDRSES
jgi:thymidine phosphorylase